MERNNNISARVDHDRTHYRSVVRRVTMRTGLARQDARDDFDRARRRASWARLTGWLHGRPSNRLAVLGEVMTTGTAGPTVRRLEYECAGASGRAAGTLVPIDQIVGTVEPTRLFDRR